MALPELAFAAINNNIQPTGNGDCHSSRRTTRQDTTAQVVECKVRYSVKRIGPWHSLHSSHSSMSWFRSMLTLKVVLLSRIPRMHLPMTLN